MLQEQLVHQDFTKFHALKPKLLETVDKMLAEDIARLMNMVPQASHSILLSFECALILIDRSSLISWHLKHMIVFHLVLNAFVIS